MTLTNPLPPQDAEWEGNDRLDKGLDAAPLESWTVASMKDDWSHIFPAEK